MRNWIQSYTGLAVTPLNLKPEQVCLADVAHALAMKCRFTGHTRDFYSVAQHCVLGSECIAPSYALAFLLHDVSEAYLPDIATPIKPFVFVRRCDGHTMEMTWKGLEISHRNTILNVLGHQSLLPLLDSAEVQAMDRSMLLAERDALFGRQPCDWKLGGEPAPVSIKPWLPEQAESEFLRRYERLQKMSSNVGL